MLRIVLIFLFLFFVLTGKSQCDTGTIKIPLYFHVTDTAHYWNYYNSNGVILWRNVNEYNVSLIPVGGYIGNGDYLKQPYIVKGFGVFRVKTDCSLDLIKRLDVNDKDIEIKGRIVNPAILPR